MFIHFIIDKNSKTLLFHPILSYLKVEKHPNPNPVLPPVVQINLSRHVVPFPPQNKKYFPSGSTLLHQFIIILVLLLFYIPDTISFLYYVLLNSDHHLKTNQEHLLLIDSLVYINIGINVKTKYI